MKITITRETAVDGYSTDRAHKKRRSLVITVEGLPHDPREISEKARSIYRIASLCENIPETPPGILACMDTVKGLAEQILENVT